MQCVGASNRNRSNSSKDPCRLDAAVVHPGFDDDSRHASVLLGSPGTVVIPQTISASSHHGRSRRISVASVGQRSSIHFGGSPTGASPGRILGNVDGILPTMRTISSSEQVLFGSGGWVSMEASPWAPTCALSPLAHPRMVQPEPAGPPPYSYPSPG